MQFLLGQEKTIFEQVDWFRNARETDPDRIYQYFAKNPHQKLLQLLEKYSEKTDSIEVKIHFRNRKQHLKIGKIV